MALEKKVSQDAAIVKRLRKEQDKIIQTMERLLSERGTDCKECDQAF